MDIVYCDNCPNYGQADEFVNHKCNVCCEPMYFAVQVCRTCNTQIFSIEKHSEHVIAYYTATLSQFNGRELVIDDGVTRDQLVSRYKESLRLKENLERIESEKRLKAILDWI